MAPRYCRDLIFHTVPSPDARQPQRLMSLLLQNPKHYSPPQGLCTCSSLPGMLFPGLQIIIVLSDLCSDVTSVHRPSWLTSGSHCQPTPALPRPFPGFLPLCHLGATKFIALPPCYKPALLHSGSRTLMGSRKTSEQVHGQCALLNPGCFVAVSFSCRSQWLRQLSPEHTALIAAAPHELLLSDSIVVGTSDNRSIHSACQQGQ